MNPNYPRRGDVYWAELDPAQGAAMQKTRPCVVVTNDIINQRRHTVVIIPLSNTSPKKPPLYVPLPSMGHSSQAVIDQIRVVDKGSIGKKIGSATSVEMQQIEDAIRIVLDLQ
jgi:mRNA interferase MazF